MISYTMIERICAYPCCHLFQNLYLQYLDVSVPIHYFTCHHGIGLFDMVTDLINHFLVQQHLEKNDINHHHRIFYVCFSFYPYCSKK